MKQEMLSLKLQGQSYRAISVLAGISRQRVQQLLAPPRAIRAIVVKRAEGICQGCQIYVGNSGHVHHQGAHEGENYNDLDNLELLCPSCHRTEHLPIIKQFPMKKPAMFYLKAYKLPLTISVTEEQEEKLRLLKQETGVGVSEIIRQALTQYFPKVMPAPTDLGIIKKEEQADAD